MTNTERRAEFMRRVGAFLVSLAVAGIRVASFSFYRTAQEQLMLFNLGKSNCDGTVKVSAHQKWLAMDFAILNESGTDFVWDSAAYAEFGRLAEQAGLTWGGRWASLNDCYHIELPKEDD